MYNIYIDNVIQYLPPFYKNEIKHTDRKIYKWKYNAHGINCKIDNFFYHNKS